MASTRWGKTLPNTQHNARAKPMTNRVHWPPGGQAARGYNGALQLLKIWNTPSLTSTGRTHSKRTSNGWRRGGPSWRGLLGAWTSHTGGRAGEEPPTNLFKTNEKRARKKKKTE